MHEVSLVSALVDKVAEVAAQQGFDRVLAIRLSVGALSGVESECVEFCFSEVTRGSMLDGAKLVIENVSAELVCRKCGHLSRPEDCADLFCARCHSGDVNVRKGREFKIVDLEVV